MNEWLQQLQDQALTDLDSNEWLGCAVLLPSERSICRPPESLIHRERLMRFLDFPSRRRHRPSLPLSTMGTMRIASSAGSFIALRRREQRDAAGCCRCPTTSTTKWAVRTRLRARPSENRCSAPGSGAVLLLLQLPY